MTGLEILNAARPLSPRIQLRDVWHLMREFETRGLATCLNSNERTGRLYHLTEFGRQIVQFAFSISVDPLPAGIDWVIYSRIARAKTRRWILSELARPRFDGKQSMAATQIRRGLLDRCPLGLNPTIRALQELCADRLIKVSGTTKKRKQKLYRLTAVGKRLHRQLKRPASRSSRDSIEQEMRSRTGRWVGLRIFRPNTREMSWRSLSAYRHPR